MIAAPWAQAAAAETLKDAKEQEQSQGGSDAAKKRADGKNNDAEHEEILAADNAGGPSAHWKDDCVGYEIGSENPSAFVKLAPRLPAICGRATLAMLVSRTSMKAARATVAAMSHGLVRGRHAACAASSAVAESATAGFVAKPSLSFHQRFWAGATRRTSHSADRGYRDNSSTALE